MSEPNGKLWDSILQRFILPLACFSFGFGSSQMLAVQTLHDKVHETVMAVAATGRDLSREADARVLEEREIRNQISSDRDQTEKRMSYVVTLMEGLMKQNSEVIGLFRLQQQVK